MGQPVETMDVHRANLAVFARRAASALSDMTAYWDEHQLPGDITTPETGYPFDADLDEIVVAIHEWVDALDPRPLPGRFYCENPEGNGSECGLYAHFEVCYYADGSEKKLACGKHLPETVNRVLAGVGKVLTSAVRVTPLSPS